MTSMVQTTEDKYKGKKKIQIEEFRKIEGYDLVNWKRWVLNKNACAYREIKNGSF